MRRENEERGCFLQCDHTGEKQKSKNKKTGLNSQKISGKRKNAVLWKFGFCGKHHKPAHFLEEKKSESHPSFFISKKKKNLKMKKVERKTEIFFLKMSRSVVFGGRTQIS